MLAQFIGNNQLDIMLFFSGVCAVLIPLTWVTSTLTRQRKWILTMIELVSALLLIFDRFAYIYRGSPDDLTYWMVRISNFMVFGLQLFQLMFFNLYPGPAGQYPFCLYRLYRQPLFCHRHPSAAR